jgi:chromosomal replication initiator protein
MYNNSGPFQENQEKASLPTNGLNSRYTFENLIVGESNQVAMAVSRLIAEKPGQLYNPLLILGEYGVGKTHLLNAIGHHALQLRPELKVRYTTAEGFTNGLINAIRQTRMADFQKDYRSLDLLLVDNIEYLAGKEQTQSELLHTLESLGYDNRQVILTARRLPGAMSTMADKLLLRLQSGMITNLMPPDHNLRLTFLQTKAEQQPAAIAPEVLELIADKVTDSFSRLEGALNSLVASTYHSGTPLTPEIAGKLLDVLLFSSSAARSA